MIMMTLTSFLAHETASLVRRARGAFGAVVGPKWRGPEGAPGGGGGRGGEGGGPDTCHRTQYLHQSWCLLGLHFRKRGRFSEMAH